VTLVATDQGPVVQSALLRGELVRLRRESGLTQEQVAADLEWSPSKLIRVEGGRSSITKVDLDALLARYGVTSESTRERLQLLNRGARERGWWDKYRDDVAYLYAVNQCDAQLRLGFPVTTPARPRWHRLPRFHARAVTIASCGS